MKSDVPAIVPAYQAARSVARVVRQTLERLETVLVVDDGSTDGTGEAAREAGAEVVRHPCNLGKGRALATGFETLFARGHDRAVTLDADGQHRADQIPRLLEAGRGVEGLVIGSRDHLFEEMHGVRRFSNRISSVLISAVAGQSLFDVQSGFRLYSRRLIRATGFPEPRFEAESAVVVRAVRLGWPVVCVPIELGFVDGRSTSHYRPLIDSARIAGAVTRARMETIGCPSARSS